MAMTDGAGPGPEYEISLIQPSDFQNTASMLADAFSDKQGRWCCALICSRSETINEQMRAFQIYQQQNPAKLQHIAVIRDADGSILGYCALQMQGDLGNCTMPESTRHTLQPGEVHLEQIGVSEQARGRGIGKKLMAWAHTTARDAGATFISLEVISVNRAKRLYKCEGYAVTSNPEGDGCITWCFSCSFIWCCMCCRYTAVDYMVKQLKD